MDLRPHADEPLSARLELRRMAALGRREMKYLVYKLIDDWFRHRVPRLSASLAFYTMLSLAPLLIVVLAIAGIAFGREAAAGQLVWQIGELVGREGAETIQTLIKQASNPAAGTLATTVGLITLFFGASAVVAELRDALNIIWDVPERATEFGWRSVLAVLRERTLSFAVVLAFGFLLLVSLAVNAFLAAMGGRFHRYFATPDWAVNGINLIVSFAVITALFAMLFKYLPDIHVAWSDVLLGAFGTALLFTIGKLAIGMYLGKAGVGSAYGAAGSLVVVLVWVYYSAQIFFLGAEFTQAYASAFGSRPHDKAAREAALVKPGEPQGEQRLVLPDDIRPDARIEL